MFELAANQNLPSYGGLVYLLIIGLATYFLLIRPAKKKQKEFDEMLSQLKAGDSVITKSGVVGKVVELDDRFFILETAKETKIKFILNAVNVILDDESQVEEVVEEEVFEEEIIDDDLEQDVEAKDLGQASQETDNI